ncbi:hypothetical protein BH09PAT4_BH09PAT4_08840 [soil metagenome]
MKTHKVGQDIIFTSRNLASQKLISPVSVLVVLTVSFFLSQCLILFK